MTKHFEKITAEKKLFKNLQFTFAMAFMKDVQDTGEAFSPQKRTPSTAKLETSSLLSIFVGNLCPGSESAFQ
jgi:hypothetical protein